MTTIFSSNETTSLEREVEYTKDVLTISNVWNELECQRCVNWILNHKFERVCLQFPDNLLCFSTTITANISSKCKVGLFILGDTSYGSCCIDTTAAAHIKSEGIIHFGPACLSKVIQIPVLYIFTKLDYDGSKFITAVEDKFPHINTKIKVFYDTSYYHKINEIESIRVKYVNAEIGSLAIYKESDVLCWVSDLDSISEYVCIYIGKDSQSFFNLSVSLKAKSWFLFDVQSNILSECSPLSTNWMKKRYYFIEKCKDAQSIGIVVGTLSTEGYLNVVTHIQNLAKKQGIRSYIFSVGKVNPAKLANFIDIDCFVLVGCPENIIYNSRDFFKPLISVFELEMALNPAWNTELPDTYYSDFREILPNGKLFRNENNYDVIENDISLVSGRVRSINPGLQENEPSTSDLIEKTRNDVAVLSSSDTFNDRSWQGLDPKLGQNEPVSIEKGRAGLAIQYLENPN